MLEARLSEGTYREVRQATWEDFAAAHVASIAGDSNRSIAKNTLREFGQLYNVQPRQVTHVMLKAYVASLRKRGNSAATINKKFRYLRSAFNEGVEDGYLAKNPMGKRWKWEPEQEVYPREVTPAEEAKMLASAEELFGFRMRSLIYVDLNCGGRCGEILGLRWKNIDLEPIDEAEVTFPKTKGRKPRRVPVNPEVVTVLQRLKAQTLQDGGPFRSWSYDQVQGMFERVLKHAGVTGVTLHDLRRTYATRLIRRGVELSAVQRLCGHSAIQTTLKYYNAVHKDSDLRAAVAKLREDVG